MRALLSWDVEPADPQFQQILIDLAGVLPPGKMTPLTNHTAMLEPISTSGFQDLARNLDALAARYADRLFFVFSLHPAGSVIWGHWRQPAHNLLVNDDSLGFGPGAGAPPANPL